MSDAGLREIETELGAPGLAEGVEADCARAPDPDAALRRCRDVLAAGAAAEATSLAGAWREHPGAVRRLLHGGCAIGPFLARFLVGHPDWLPTLAREDLAEPRSPEIHEAALDAALDGAEDAPATLRRFKYRELVRICARDGDPALVPLARVGEPLAELSHLADALLGGALACAAERTRERLGDAPGLRFAVLGLGKLGGHELNFSSDVDLVYAYDGAAGDGDVSPAQWAGRLADAFGAILTESTADGFLYRVDLDLRPEGAEGPRVVSADVITAYYDGWAAMWEKAAFMKARPVAGDLRFGWGLVRGIHPMIYRSTIDFGGVAAIREMKDRVEREHGSEIAFDVKLGAGGIRDVEFIAQASQLFHGGRVPQLRGRSTQATLESLESLGILPAADAETLLSAYRFLRRVENRLQMAEERQVHRLPGDDAGRERLARAVGAEDAAAFDRALELHRRGVRERFDALFREGDEDRVLSLFARSAPQLLSSATTRSMVEGLAGSFAREIEASADPELALNNLDRFVEGIGRRSGYYGLLLDRPELVQRLTAVFGGSKYLSNLIAGHPGLIEPVFRDPDVLLLSRAELEADLASLRAELETEDRDPVERDLAALRRFQNRQAVNVGLLDLDGKIGRREAERALTEIAEVCLEGALASAHAQLERRGVDPAGRFLVVGMGKLASGELTYGSDLDVIFLYEAEEEEVSGQAQSSFGRLAQRLIGALDTTTAEGSCYSVDARLRPSGGQGALVTSLAGWRSHHAQGAMAWERQALLRARAVAGDPALADRFASLRLEILAAPPPDDLAEEIHRVRMRMEQELAQEGEGRRDLKTGRGGLVDVESVVQFLQLRHGAAHPELFEPSAIDDQLARIRELGLLEADAARVLAEGWEFLQRLSSRLRIVQNRSISDLREDRSDLDSVARSMGYTASSRSGDARRPLLDDYRRHTEAIRRVYLEVLGVA